jgi:peptide/nickel transport system permease protein
MSEPTATPTVAPEMKPGPVSLEDAILVGGKASSDERFYYASQWELIRWRFGRHKMAVFSLVVLIILYILAIFAEFFSPYTVDTRFEGFQQASPSKLHWIKPGGGFGPDVFGIPRELNPDTFRFIFTEDTSQVYPVKFLVHGPRYKFWGLFYTDWHLFGVGSEQPLLLFRP